MIILILTVLIGIGFAYFATQNTIGVPVQIGNNFYSSVPLYAIALGSLLLGLAISGILRMIDWAATGLTLRGKDNQIRQTESTVEQLNKKIKDLEMENSRLRGEDRGNKRADLEHEVHDGENPSLKSRLRHSISR